MFSPVIVLVSVLAIRDFKIAQVPRLPSPLEAVACLIQFYRPSLSAYSTASLDRAAIHFFSFLFLFYFHLLRRLWQTSELWRRRGSAAGLSVLS